MCFGFTPSIGSKAWWSTSAHLADDFIQSDLQLSRRWKKILLKDQTMATWQRPVAQSFNHCATRSKQERSNQGIMEKGSKDGFVFWSLAQGTCCSLAEGLSLDTVCLLLWACSKGITRWNSWASLQQQTSKLRVLLKIPAMVQDSPMAPGISRNQLTPVDPYQSWDSNSLVNGFRSKYYYALHH